MLVLSAQRQPIRVPATAIDTLWTRGNSAKTGAIVGALVGGALGAGLGLLCGEGFGENDCNTGQAVLLLGGLGLGGGGLLGALIGVATPRWQRQYP